MLNTAGGFALEIWRGTASGTGLQICGGKQVGLRWSCVGESRCYSDGWVWGDRMFVCVGDMYGVNQVGLSWKCVGGSRWGWVGDVLLETVGTGLEICR